MSLFDPELYIHLRIMVWSGAKEVILVCFLAAGARLHWILVGQPSFLALHTRQVISYCRSFLYYLPPSPFGLVYIRPFPALGCRSPACNSRVPVGYRTCYSRTLPYSPRRTGWCIRRRLVPYPPPGQLRPPPSGSQISASVDFAERISGGGFLTFLPEEFWMQFSGQFSRSCCNVVSWFSDYSLYRFSTNVQK